MAVECLLNDIPLLQALPPEEKERLRRSLKHLSLRRGDVLFRKDSEGNTLYIIISGKIKIVLPSTLGEELVLAVFSDGDFFGEMSLLDGMPRSADAVALEKTELLSLEGSDFITFLQHSQGALKAVLRSLSLRLRKTDDLLEDTCFLNVSGRLAKKLVQMVEERGALENNQASFELSLTQSELANMISASRESVNKELRTLREKGLISVEKGLLKIHNMERLKRRIK